MTYKRTERAAAFHDRVASSSTKPFATGRVEVLPPEARPKEEMYLRLLEQFDILREQLRTTTEEAQWINKRLENRLPREEYERVMFRKSVLVPQVQALQETVGQFRILVRNVGRESWATAFYVAARNMLTKQMYDEVYEAVTEIMKRRPVEIKATDGGAEATESRKQVVKDADNRRDKRQRYERTKEKLEAIKDGRLPSDVRLPRYYKP